MKSTVTILFATLGVLLVAGTPSMTGQKIDAQMVNTTNMTGMMPSKMTSLAHAQNITGSIKLMPTIFNAISSQINVSLSDAALNAEKDIGNNSHALAAHVGQENGYLVYNVGVMDPDMNVHRVIVDPGDGKVLSSQKLSMKEMSMMMGPGMIGGMIRGGMMMDPDMMMKSGMMFRGQMMNPDNMMGDEWKDKSH